MAVPFTAFFRSVVFLIFLNLALSTNLRPNITYNNAIKPVKKRLQPPTNRCMYKTPPVVNIKAAKAATIGRVSFKTNKIEATH